MQMLLQVDDLTYLDMTFNSDIQQFIINPTTMSSLHFGSMEVL